MIAESYASQAPFAQGGLSGPAEAFQTSRSHVRNVYSEQVPDYSRYRRFLIPRKTTPVYSYRLRELWVADIAVMPDFVRRNPTTPYKNCLVIMDHFSKMVWVFPLKTKSAREVATKFQHLFQLLGQSPQRLWTDRG